MSESNPYAPPVAGSRDGSLVCARCGAEMSSGFVSSASTIEWIDPNTSAMKAFTTGHERLAGGSFALGPFKLRAYRCRQCEYIHLPL